MLALKQKQTDEPESVRARIDWTPLPKQRIALETPAFETLYGGAAGGGKLLALDTPIPTPGGFTALGDLAVGDAVFDECGRPIRVLALSDIELPVTYCVKFDDGSQIIAGAEHRWLTLDASELAALTRRDDAWRAQRRERRSKRVGGQKSALFTKTITERNQRLTPPTKPAPTGTLRTTAEIAATLLTPRGRRNHAIPVAQPLDLWPADNLPLDPYTLGAWLGDGTSASGGFTGIDPEIWQEIEQVGFAVTHGSAKTHYIRDLVPKLRACGVLNNKHIPMRYLRAGDFQRLALLQGLMDTDGTVTKTGAAEFTTTSRALAEGVYDLIVGFGWKVHLREGRAKLYDKDCGPKYTLKWTPDLIVFRLPRKALKQALGTRRTGKFRYVVACEQIDSVPMRCIQVASPTGLYLAGRAMIPTHNSDLLVALARMHHRKALLLRRTFPDLERSLIVRSLDLYGDNARYNAGKHVWSWQDSGQRIEFGHLQDEKDVQGYQSAQYDLIGFDELTQFTMFQYRYMMSRARTTERGQRVRIVACTNPGNEGNDWVMERWAAWLDEGYPHPAEPGEVRWFKPNEEGRDTETTADDPDALSRTFIAARLDDNPHLPDEYRKQLNALPEPWRSQLKEGRWTSGLFDDPYQIIPTAWIRAAQKRWTSAGREGFLTTLGVDPARGGQDQTVLAPRYGNWIGPLAKYDGRATTTGFSVVQLMLPYLNRGGTANIDVIGIGSAVIDAARDSNLKVVDLNVSSPSDKTDKSGKIRMVNLRAYLYWLLREALDPEGDSQLALPPDPELLGDLRATKWTQGPRGIKIIDKDEIRQKIGRSPNCADAVALAMYQPDPIRGGIGRIF